MALLSLRSPFSPLRDSRDRFEDVWSVFPGGSMFRRGDGGMSGVSSPRVDIYETDENTVVECELPGMQKDDIHVDVEDDRLIIAGERNEAKETEDRNYVRSERRYEAFERSFSLPAGVDSKHVDAEYRDGVLTVTLPKTTEAKARQIEVK